MLNRVTENEASAPSMKRKNDSNESFFDSNQDSQGCSQALIDEVLTIRDIDPDGQKFRSVSRAYLDGDKSRLKAILDLNSDLFPIEKGERVQFLLVDNIFDQPQTIVHWGGVEEPISNLFDQFPYIMSGQVYRVDKYKLKQDDPSQDPIENLVVYVSFGGLLLRMQADLEVFERVHNDKIVFLLLRKFAE